MTSPLLEDLRIIELTTAWAGPLVGRFLGALGADVIKVEFGRALDIWRGPMPFGWCVRPLPPGVGERDLSLDVSTNFNTLNRNKRSVNLDVTDPAGRDAFLQLVGGADAVVANLTANVLPKLGLDYDDLRAARDDIVLLTMPALGASGPFREAAGYGSLIEGMGGLAARFGTPSEDARVSPVYFPDPVAGLTATVALLGALVRRRDTGRGCCIDLSQQEAMWTHLGEGIVKVSRGGDEPGRLGNSEPGTSVSGVYGASDGRWVALVAAGQREVEQLHRVLGAPTDDRTQRAGTDAAVATWIGSQPGATAVEALATGGVRARLVRDHASSVSDRSAVRQAGLVEEVVHPVTGVQEYVRVPVRFDGKLPPTRRAAPTLGQHTHSVLAEVLSKSDLDDLRRREVIDRQPETLTGPI